MHIPLCLILWQHNMSVTFLDRLTKAGFGIAVFPSKERNVWIFESCFIFELNNIFVYSFCSQGKEWITQISSWYELVGHVWGQFKVVLQAFIAKYTPQFIALIDILTSLWQLHVGLSKLLLLYYGLQPTGSMYNKGPQESGIQDNDMDKTPKLYVWILSGMSADLRSPGLCT